MEGILGLIVLILNILATLKLLKAKADSVKKLVWLLVIWLIPAIGVLLWFVLGGPGAKARR
jgi:hypothetical protein